MLLAGCGGSGDGDSSGEAGVSTADHGKYIDWPFFGRVPERTHYLPGEGRILNPPLKKAWSINTHALIEFPPAIAGGVAYVINKYGNGLAVRLDDHKVLWKLQVHPSNKGEPVDVTGPAYGEGRVYGAFVDGTIVAGDAKTGKKLWLDRLDARLESSPLIIDGTLYLGTNTTDVLALDAAGGKIRWRFNSPAPIKASPSYHDGNVFVADYRSAMFALEAKTGKPIWRTDTSKVAPFGEGGFFSSPAIDFGRVYAARDDGTVYAFDEQTGKVDWSFPTGDLVYGSPAVAQVPGTPPTVYIGSENGRFFALDAATGKVRWSADIGGPIPGTATVIGHTVYTSSFKTQRTIGFDVRSHKKTFEIHQSGYTPVVSDGRRLILVGYYDLIGLQPSRR